MTDAAARGEWRDREQRHPGAVAEEIERLDIARIPVAAALIEGDEDRGTGPERGMRFHRLDQPARKRLQDVELRAAGMAVIDEVRLDEGHRGQRLGIDI